MNIYNGMSVYIGWDQWISKQKNRFKRYLKWARCKRQTTIHAFDLNENHLKNKENLSHPQLVLSIEPGQTFWIGEEIQVSVLGSSNRVIRIGIKAPLETKITRETRQNKGAADE